MSKVDFSEVVLEVSDFIGLINQTLEYAYPEVTIRGELSNFRISKNKWIYFDLKDATATLRFFGTVYQLPGPLEDGMLLRVRGVPKLHPQYGFSVTILRIQPEGEGAIRRAAELLRLKLEAEGLFDETRKRSLPYPPTKIGLITSQESAAYADFVKILNARWHSLVVEHVDVQVQGEVAPEQIVAAIQYLNQRSIPPEILILTRGGGSADDLMAFNTEVVTRAVAGSRVPTLVAVGHEVDISLAELAADKRASTPSNAAELLVPDRHEILRQLDDYSFRLREAGQMNIRTHLQSIKQYQSELEQLAVTILERWHSQLATYEQLLGALNPQAIIERGFAIVRLNDKIVRRKKDVKQGDIVNIQLSDGRIDTTVR